MTSYIGIDVHSKTSTAVAVDQKGKILAKDQFPTTDGHFLGFISKIPGKKALAVEETNLAQWVYLLLRNKVEDLAIAHAAHLRKQHGAKTDFVDAVRLAEELRLGTITRVHHEDTPLWNLRVLVQAYLDVTEDLVRAKNRYKALLRTLRLPSTGASVYTDAALLKQIDKAQEKFVAMNNFEQIRALQEIKDSYEERFEAVAAALPVVGKLKHIPGIASVRACILASTICTAARFSNKHKLWAYAMLVSHVRESDGVRYGVTRIRGRTELKAVFMGAAISCLTSENNGLRRYYDRLRSKGTSHRDARKAVARRIAAIVLMTMRTGKTYDEKSLEGGSASMH